MIYPEGLVSDKIMKMLEDGCNMPFLKRHIRGY